MKLTEEQWKEVQAKRVRGGSGCETPYRASGSRREPAIHKTTSRRSESAPSPNKPPYKSKLELAWATRLEVMKRQGEIDGWLYEPFTFRLAEGKRYRADFLAWRNEVIKDMYEQDVIIQVTTAYECKGWHKNFRDSLTHMKWAAQRFPFFQWKKVLRNGKSGFEVYDVVV